MIFGHRHIWEARATTVDRYGGWSMAGVTRVLYSCSKCGKLKTKKIPGRWVIHNVATGGEENLNRFLDGLLTPEEDR